MRKSYLQDIYLLFLTRQYFIMLKLNEMAIFTSHNITTFIIILTLYYTDVNLSCQNNDTFVFTLYLNVTSYLIK